MERKKLIELCNRELIRIRENYRLLEKNVSKTHPDILSNFNKLN